MKKTLISTGLIALSALTVSALPTAANAATSAPHTVAVTAKASSSDFNEAVNSNLTFVGGRIDGLSDLHAIDGTTMGTSTSPTQFTQDDGWNQEWQEWTPGNELKFGGSAYGEDLEFTLANLSFAGGKARGTMYGPHRDIWGPGLEQVNLAGDRKGTPAAKVAVNGSDVVISGETMDGYQYVLEFTLRGSDNRPLG